jgi:hypothetical protein
MQHVPQSPISPGSWEVSTPPCSCLTTCLLLFFFLLASVFINAYTAYADNEPVTARFTNSHGTEMTVELNASKPVPGSVIFTLSLPKKVKLIKADPPAGKYDKEKGQVKWLLRGLSPGAHTIRLHFSADVKANSLNAEIRYLNSATGKLCVLPVTR